MFRNFRSAAELCLIVIKQCHLFNQQKNFSEIVFTQILDIYFNFKIVSSLLFRYSIFKEPVFIEMTFEVISMIFFFSPRLRRGRKVITFIFPLMVGWRGLEPPTSRLSAECSNQLSYQPLLRLFSSLKPIWWRLRESNPWPPACKAGALPAELNPRIFFFPMYFRVYRRYFENWTVLIIP